MPLHCTRYAAVLFITVRYGAPLLLRRSSPPCMPLLLQSDSIGRSEHWRGRGAGSVRGPVQPQPFREQLHRCTTVRILHENRRGCGLRGPLLQENGAGTVVRLCGCAMFIWHVRSSIGRPVGVYRIALALCYAPVGLCNVPAMPW